MIDRRLDSTVIIRPDPPSNLMRALFDCKGERPFITESKVVGNRLTALVDTLVSTVLCFMFLHETEDQEFRIEDITSNLELSQEDVGRALMFLYIHGLVLEIDRLDGPVTYMLTERGIDLACRFFFLEEMTKCAWKVGLGIDEETRLMVPVLLSPNPFVIIEGEN